MNRKILVGVAMMSLLTAAIGIAGEEWTYDDKTGPAQWGEMSPEWEVCGSGRYQSPIDIKDGIPCELGGIDIKIKDTPMAWGLDGPTFKVPYEAGSWIMVNGTEYALLQFHFHHTSEHAVNGKHYAMEAHLVLKSKGSDHADAVMGIFIEPGKKNAMLDQFWGVLPRSDKKSIDGMKVNVGDLFPAKRNFFMYEGSMTTPACNQGVRWFVLENPVQASQDQIDLFIKDFTAGKTNNRPLQPLYGRKILNGK